jgi:hypothetical protein
MDARLIRRTDDMSLQMVEDDAAFNSGFHAGAWKNIAPRFTGFPPHLVLLS